MSNLFYITMYTAFPSRLKELCMADCVDCGLLSPQVTPPRCVWSSSLFWFKSKHFIRETKRVGHMRTYDLAKRSEKFQHIIYKNISKSALRLYIVYKGKRWGLGAPQSVFLTQESSGSLPL